jgi:hypothetical protein
MPSCDDQAVAYVGAWILVGWHDMEGHGFVVLPQEAARQLDLASDLATHEAVAGHMTILRRRKLLHGGKVPTRPRVTRGTGRVASPWYQRAR